MGILTLPFDALHHLVTYLYPLYASYKAISSKRASSWPAPTAHGPEPRTEMAELEGWLMYWSVVGIVTVIESWFEWTWSWLPFYAIAKTAFTLWLVLPQTQGATHLYIRYLGPFLQSHEDDIDVALESARCRATQALGTWVAVLWQQFRTAILGAATSQHSLSSSASDPTQPPSKTHDPATGSASQVFRLFKHYVPLAATSIVNAMDNAAAAAAAATATAGTTPRVASSSTVQEAAMTSANVQPEPNIADRARQQRMSALEQRLDELDPDSGSLSSSSGDLSGDEGSHSSTPARNLSGSFQLVDETPVLPAPQASTLTSRVSSWFAKSS